MSCTTKSITLAKGETFVLPSGAEIVYVSDPGNITSIADCAIVPTTTAVCYMFQYPIHGTDSNNINVSSDNAADFRINGIFLDDLLIPINPFYTVNGSLGTAVMSTSSENPQEYVDRLANNLWDQIQNNINKALILGLQVDYIDWSAGDQVGTIIHVPDIFTTVKLSLFDINNYNMDNHTTANATFYSIGQLRDCKSYMLGSGDEGEAKRGNVGW